MYYWQVHSHTVQVLWKLLGVVSANLQLAIRIVIDSNKSLMSGNAIACADRYIFDLQTIGLSGHSNANDPHHFTSITATSTIITSGQ